MLSLMCVSTPRVMNSVNSSSLGFRNFLFVIRSPVLEEYNAILLKLMIVIVSWAILKSLIGSSSLNEICLMIFPVVLLIDTRKGLPKGARPGI